MKNIYILLFMFAFISINAQDTLKTEIVFVTPGDEPVKVYKLVKEKFIYYGGTNYYGSEYSENGYYPYKGTSYEREFITTAPGSIFIPNNSEMSFVVMDNQDLDNRFTTTTDGRKQIWSLVPAGKNYRLGRNVTLVGVAGFLGSSVLYMLAAHQNEAYKQEMNMYKDNLAFQQKYFTGSGQITTTGSQTFDYGGQTITIPSATVFSQPGFAAPTPPKDNRMGFAIPVVTSSISLAAIITGFKIWTKNSPKAVRLE